MFGKAQIKNANIWKSENREFQSLEKSKQRIPMFQKEKIENSNVWKREIREIQCLKKRKSRTPMFGKANNHEFQCLEKPK